MKGYAPLNTHVIVSAPPIVPAVELTGLSDDDDAIMIKRRTDLATDKVGMRGEMVVSYSPDKSGEITLKVFQESPANKILNTIANLQQGGPSRACPVQFLFQDDNRQDRGVGSFGYIKALPEISRGKESAVQEWTIVVERLDLLLGNPLFAGLAIAAAEAA